MTSATSRKDQRRSRPTSFVRARCRLRPVPLVPEIRLYQADEAFSLWEEIERASGGQATPPPFWGFAWPGGQALGRYLLDRPELVAGRSVLDVGSGSGLAAIARRVPGHRLSQPVKSTRLRQPQSRSTHVRMAPR